MSAVPQTSRQLQRIVYTIRVAFSFMALILLAINDAICLGQPGNHLWLLIAGLLYPHLGQAVLGRFDIRRRRGHALFLFDGLFVGAVLGALEFAIIPGTVLLVINLFNWMVVGGPMLVVLGLTALFVGSLATWISPVFPMAATNPSCTASLWLATILLLGYFLIVARIIHNLIGELRLQQLAFQARSDSAHAAKTLAEQALLAVLPASAARRLEGNPDLSPQYLDNATLLLLRFGLTGSPPPHFTELKDSFKLCDMILARHGFELIKTFGQQTLAISQRETGPDDAVKAFFELDIFLANHPGQGCAPLAQAALHQAPVTIGLVQPARMNLDLFGESMDQLAELSGEILSESHSISQLIASPTAYRGLTDTSGFIPLEANCPTPSAYLCRQHPAT